MRSLQTIATVFTVCVATVAMLRLSARATRSPLRVSTLPYVNSQVRYQLWLAGIAVLTCLVVGTMHPQNLRIFVSVGDVHAPANGVPVFGIRPGESWRSVGTSLSVFATLATTFVMFAPQRRHLRHIARILPYLLWVVLFALCNSLFEELIYRLGVLVPLAGTVHPSVVTLLSAVLFGLPHLRGLPSGLGGALMAGVLGWLLARSVLETQGIAWAWGIHFLQDIPIYAAMILHHVRPRDVTRPVSDETHLTPPITFTTTHD